jgi:hypothetical protein
MTRYETAIRALPIRKRAIVGGLAASVVAATLISDAHVSAHAQPVSIVRVDVDIVAQGYRTSRLIGRAVHNERREEIGRLDDIIIGPQDRALFAIIQVGGFLGLGSHLIAVPYQSLRIAGPRANIILPGASNEELRRLAEFRYP